MKNQGTSSRPLILMAGGNVWGRILAARLTKFEPIVINEVGTKRAEKLSSWLAPDYGPPLGDHFAVSDLFADWPSCDYAINGGVGAILRSRHLAHPRLGFLNAHPGLLPQYRGLDPVCWTLLHGDPQGATVHMMDEGIDTGPILIRRSMPWTPACSVVELRLKVLEFAASLVSEFLGHPEAFPSQPQNLTEGNYWGPFENPERLDKSLRETGH